MGRDPRKYETRELMPWQVGGGKDLIPCSVCAEAGRTAASGAAGLRGSGRQACRCGRHRCVMGENRKTKNNKNVSASPIRNEIPRGGPTATPVLPRHTSKQFFCPENAQKKAATNARVKKEQNKSHTQAGSTAPFLPSAVPAGR